MGWEWGASWEYRDQTSLTQGTSSFEKKMYAYVLEAGRCFEGQG